VNAYAFGLSSLTLRLLDGMYKLPSHTHTHPHTHTHTHTHTHAHTAPVDCYSSLAYSRTAWELSPHWDHN